MAVVYLFRPGLVPSENEGEDNIKQHHPKKKKKKWKNCCCQRYVCASRYWTSADPSAGEKRNKMKTTKVSKCSLFFPSLSLSLLRKTGLVEIYVCVPHQRNIHHLDGVSELEKIPGVIAFGSGDDDDDAPARICVSERGTRLHTPPPFQKWRRNDDRIVREEAKQNNNNNIEAKRFSSNWLAKRFVRIGGQRAGAAQLGKGDVQQNQY